MPQSATSSPPSESASCSRGCSGHGAKQRINVTRYTDNSSTQSSGTLASCTSAFVAAINSALPAAGNNNQAANDEDEDVPVPTGEGARSAGEGALSSETFFGTTSRCSSTKT